MTNRNMSHFTNYPAPFRKWLTPPDGDETLNRARWDLLSQANAANYFNFDHIMRTLQVLEARYVNTGQPEAWAKAFIEPGTTYLPRDTVTLTDWAYDHASTPSEQEATLRVYMDGDYNTTHTLLEAINRVRGWYGLDDWPAYAPGGYTQPIDTGLYNHYAKAIGAVMWPTMHIYLNSYHSCIKWKLDEVHTPLTLSEYYAIYPSAEIGEVWIREHVTYSETHSALYPSVYLTVTPPPGWTHGYAGPLNMRLLYVFGNGDNNEREDAAGIYAMSDTPFIKITGTDKRVNINTTPASAEESAKVQAFILHRCCYLQRETTSYWPTARAYAGLIPFASEWETTGAVAGYYIAHYSGINTLQYQQNYPTVTGAEIYGTRTTSPVAPEDIEQLIKLDVSALYQANIDTYIAATQKKGGIYYEAGFDISGYDAGDIWNNGRESASDIILTEQRISTGNVAQCQPMLWRVWSTP